MSGRALFGNVEGVLSVTEDSILLKTPSGIDGIERSAVRMVEVADGEILVAYANGPKVESIKIKPLEGSTRDWMFALQKNVPHEYFTDEFERMFQMAKKGLMEYKKMTDIPIRKLNECTTPISEDRAHFNRVTEWRNVDNGACKDNADVEFWREITNIVWADMEMYYSDRYLKDAPPVHPAGWDEEDPRYMVGRSILDDFYDTFELPDERRKMLGKLLLVQYLWKLRRAENGFAEDSIGVPWEDYRKLWPDDYEKYFMALGVLDGPIITEELLAKIRAKGRVDDLRNTADPKQVHFKERVAEALAMR